MAKMYESANDVVNVAKMQHEILRMNERFMIKFILTIATGNDEWIEAHICD